MREGGKTWFYLLAIGLIVPWASCLLGADRMRYRLRWPGTGWSP